MSELDDLLAFVFDGKSSPLRAEFETWVRGSRRFKTFATAHQNKIRTKLRNVRDEGGTLDVRAELLTAVLLLREERFTLEYEKFAALKQRAPDFTVTFKTHTPFNVEVRRIRAVESDDHLTKLITVLCDKIGQMPPGIINLLWLSAERDLSPDEVTQAVGMLMRLADTKQEEFFTRRGFENAAAFVRQFRHLSGVVLLSAGVPLVWVNAQARHKLPPEIVNALARLTPG